MVPCTSLYHPIIPFSWPLATDLGGGQYTFEKVIPGVSLWHKKSSENGKSSSRS